MTRELLRESQRAATDRIRDLADDLTSLLNHEIQDETAVLATCKAIDDTVFELISSLVQKTKKTP